MKASDFECRHQTLLHLLVAGAAVAAYLRYPDDVVWAAVRHHADIAWWERMVFGTGALMILGSAALETWRNVRLALVLLVLAVGQLLPLAGLIVLFAGEAILLLRLALRSPEVSALATSAPAVRAAAARWGLALSMLVFVWTLRDRIAEIGA